MSQPEYFIPWPHAPYPPMKQAIVTLADILDAILGRLRTYYRVELDGSWCICERVDDILGDEDREDYTITEVRMTRRQFEALPEFEGF